jgi:hypothetical protein
MLESKGGILFVAGIGFFVIAFLSNVIVPALMFQDQPELTAEEVVNPKLMYQFRELSKRYEAPFKEAFGEATPESCADALRLGRQVYMARDVGTATASLVLYPKPPSTRMNCSDPSCLEHAAWAPIFPVRGDAMETIGMRSIFTSHRSWFPSLGCHSIHGCSTKVPTNPIDVDWR